MRQVNTRYRAIQSHSRSVAEDCHDQARKAVTRHLGADKTVYGDLIEVAPTGGSDKTIAA